MEERGGRGRAGGGQFALAPGQLQLNLVLARPWPASLVHREHWPPRASRRPTTCFCTGVLDEMKAALHQQLFRPAVVDAPHRNVPGRAAPRPRAAFPNRAGHPAPHSASSRAGPGKDRVMERIAGTERRWIRGAPCPYASRALYKHN